MADCLIAHASRDNRGVLTHLGNANAQPPWRWTVADVINSIRAQSNPFFTWSRSGKRADVRIVGNHLQSAADGEPGNNLDNLPNFP